MTITSVVADPGSGAKPPIVCIHGGGCNAGYFDVPGHSFRDLALARGFRLLLVNRPGHGGSSIGMGGDMASTSQAILGHISRKLDLLGWGRDYFMLGHSIGGAVVTIAAAARPEGLLKVAVSGIGDRPTPAASLWVLRATQGQSDLAAASDLLFGPKSTYSWRAVTALRRAAEAWRPAEVAEAVEEWPRQIARYAGRVAVPVHLRLAEAEKIWESGPAAIARLAGYFSSAPEVDSAILPEGGHLYELHHRGLELMTAQLDFFDRGVTGLDQAAATE